MFCDGLAGACLHTFPTYAAAASGEPEPNRSTTNQRGGARSPQEEGSTTGQVSGVPGEKEPGGKANEERDGGSKEDTVERTPGRRTGETRERCVPDRGREDNVLGSGAQQPATLLEKLAYPGALKRHSYGKGGRVERT
ncbi:hypothetical protein NDU88_005935 [Pleurodeles waltl]|uniref:Uncharacterized protein n=1 Tax=Pleurodeles waltl TaxID=8319 RepID=A0AAV7N1K7_PLEWA|nr:hypothetical protein NDU88_005935 [Pleurodeles waltl]